MIFPLSCYLTASLVHVLSVRLCCTLRCISAFKCTETWQCCALHSCVVECNLISTCKYSPRFRGMLMLPSSGQARSHRNLENVKDKQVNQTAETRATHRLIRRGWTRPAVRRVWMSIHSRKCVNRMTNSWWFVVIFVIFGDLIVIL